MTNLIIKPFNNVFVVLLLIFTLFVILSSKLLKNKSYKTKKKFIVCFYILVFLFFLQYKYWISIDAEYSKILEDNGEGGFSWWSELPLNLCNISLVLTSLSVILNKKFLKSFVFFISPVGAFLALVIPSVGFSGYSILEPRVFGYYITHFAALISGPLLCSLGFYTPTFEDIPTCCIGSISIGLFIFIINNIFILTGVNPYSNYFYLMNPVGIVPLEILYKLIPIKGLYIIPIFLVVFIPIMLLESFIFSKVKSTNCSKVKK